MKISKKVAAIATTIAVLSAAGVAGATVSAVLTRGAGHQPGVVRCPGGMSNLSHEFNEQISVFPGDPAIHITNEYTVAVDFFKVEDIDTGGHAGTHLDVPRHFIEDGRDLTEFSAEEFVWPAYKIDVRGMAFENNQVTMADIRQYERDNGRIRRGSLVILQTGAEAFFGLDGSGDVRAVDADGNADNTDDIFAQAQVGFAADAIQWMFDKRHIDGVGADAYGPDADTDGDFLATYTTLANDGVALVAMANLDTMSVRGDVIIAPTVAMTDGSGFTTAPIACHGSTKKK